MGVIARIVAWLDRLGAWPWVIGGATIAAGYVTGLLTLVGEFPLLLQLSIYFGTASLAVGVFRSVLRRADRPAPVMVVSGVPGPMWWEGSDRHADGAWLEVRNQADKPQGDAIDVFATITLLDSNGVVFLPAFLARWRDSPYPTREMGAGEITDRQKIRAAQFRQLDVAFKYHGDDTAHALNTDAMQYPDWSKPDWELPPGTYQVKVRISGINVGPSDHWFQLINPGSGALSIEAS